MLKRTVGTHRFSRAAHVSAEKDYPVAEVAAFVGRQDFPQLHFDFHGILYVNKTESVGYPYHMSIHYDGVPAVNISGYKIGGFSADSG